MSFQHVVVTPFYVRRVLGSSGEWALASSNWLDGRLALFGTFCFPSVANQTSQDFRWLIFFDPETPAAQLDEFRRIVAPMPNVRLCFCSQWRKEAIADAIRAEVGPDCDWVVTTRLDNDDGWHEQFVERLQREVRPGKAELLNFTRGYIAAAGRTYQYEHRSNAFISSSEPAASMITPFAGNHERLGELLPVRQLDTPPSFYQMVHGGNVSNKIRGFRVPIAQASRDFGNLRFALGGATPERAWFVTVENVSIGAGRRLRDMLIAIYKHVRGARRGKAVPVTGRS